MPLLNSQQVVLLLAIIIRISCYIWIVVFVVFIVLCSNCVAEYRHMP